jgi:SAM-dependent methyltransferase
MVNRQPVETSEAGVLRQAEYQSALFARFCRHLTELGPDVAILDLGPSTPGNVMYWIGKGHRVSARDLVAHGSAGNMKLEYPDGAFGGVLCWTAPSHLEPESARELMQEIGRVLQPDGWLFSIFDGGGRHRPPAQRYRVLDEDRLGFEPMLERGSPRAVLTREVELLYQSFREVRVMVMRHGSREALGRRP